MKKLNPVVLSRCVAGVAAFAMVVGTGFSVRAQACQIVGSPVKSSKTSKGSTSSEPAEWQYVEDKNRFRNEIIYFRHSTVQVTRSIWKPGCALASVWIATPLGRGLDLRIELLGKDGASIDELNETVRAKDKIKAFNLGEYGGLESGVKVRVTATSRSNRTAEFFWAARCDTLAEVEQSAIRDIPKPEWVWDSAGDEGQNRGAREDFMHRLCVKDTKADIGDVLIPPSWIAFIAKAYDFSISFDQPLEQVIYIKEVKEWTTVLRTLFAAPSLPSVPDPNLGLAAQEAVNESIRLGP